MTKRRKNIVIICSSVLFMVAVAILLFLSKRSYSNPLDYVGNTASNLYNGGKFCEHNQKVYFANSYDNDALYVMNSDETGLKKLTSVSVLSINVDDHRIFYSQSAKSSGKGLGYVRKIAGLYSCSLNGNGSLCYTTNPVASFVLCGNHLYYQNYEKKSGTSMYSINIDRSNNHQVVNSFITMVNAINGYLYYGGMDSNHHLYVFDPYTDASSDYWASDVYMPIVHNDGWIYYMDPTANYRLKRHNTSTDTTELLVDERIDFYNIYGDIIYYQTNGKNARLCRTTTDGSEEIVLADGVYTNLQTTSNYVYFSPYSSQETTYHANHYGTPVVEAFNPGIKK